MAPLAWVPTRTPAVVPEAAATTPSELAVPGLLETHTPRAHRRAEMVEKVPLPLTAKATTGAGAVAAAVATHVAVAAVAAAVTPVVAVVAADLQ